MGASILLADDDTMLAGLTAEYLEAKGYNVTCISNAIDAFKAFKKKQFDLCILDMRMAMRSGFDLAEEIRAIDENVPMIFLTAETDIERRIKGLPPGADEYLTKPFNFKELYLRIEAILRKVGYGKESAFTTFSIGTYDFDTSTRLLKRGESETRLSDIEAQLLEAFCKAPEGRVTREYLLSSIWGDEAQVKGRSLNVYISKLRKRLGGDARVSILNVHGSGYRLVVA